jgi:hypothetical protein
MGVGMTSCALLLRTEVDLSTSRDPAFQTSFHRVLLIYPLHLHRPTAATGRCRPLGFIDAYASGGWSKLAKVVEHPDA